MMKINKRAALLTAIFITLISCAGVEERESTSGSIIGAKVTLTGRLGLKINISNLLYEYINEKGDKSYISSSKSKRNIYILRNAERGRYRLVGGYAVYKKKIGFPAGEIGIEESVDFFFFKKRGGDLHKIEIKSDPVFYGSYDLDVTGKEERRSDFYTFTTLPGSSHSFFKANTRREDTGLREELSFWDESIPLFENSSWKERAEKRRSDIKNQNGKQL